METASQTFARFVSKIESSGIPEQVRATARLVFLDTIGVALAASVGEAGPVIQRFARALEGKPESQIIGTSLRTTAANAVLANGTLAHALDYDETLEEGIIHAGCVVVTAALAVGEAQRATGKTVLEAAVAGFEVMFNIGVAAPGRFHARGFHPTAICAPFGAAAVAGKLYGLSTEQLTHAFGIAGSQSAGIIEYLADGSWTKQFHAGWGAHGGIIGALLAQSGFQGPRGVFEGRHGLFSGFAGPDGINLKRLAEIGREWHLPKVVFKLYPCGSIAHPYIDCALQIRNAPEFRVDDIESIICRTHPGPVPRLWEPLAAKRIPPTPYAAKFSLPYCVAAALVKGRVGLDEFTADAIKDPATLAVAGKVAYELDPSLDYPRHFTGHVKVRLRNGNVIEESRPHARGSIEEPIPAQEIESKFRHNAAAAVGPENAGRIAEFLSRLEEQPDVGILGSLMAGKA